jgi:DNA mismatch repair ATPase MutS
MGLKNVLAPGKNLKMTMYKYVCVMIYIGVFLYSVVQGFDIANITRSMRDNLRNKLDRIRKFVELTTKLLDSVPNHSLSTFVAENSSVFDLTVNTSLSSMYKMITDQRIRDGLKAMLQKVYVIDALNGVRSIVHTPGWSRCEYGSTTRLWGMGHPLLTNTQVRNPLSLEKNVIITGPNAAGKTTYMKAVCANIILGQTFGFVCAHKNTVAVVNAVGSLIRVNDVVGKESLFEAELRRCATIVREANALSEAGKTGMYFLDEPMHSTPPVEGTAVTMAVATYIGRLPGVRTFITTHYRDVTSLDQMYPLDWMNVSMEAIGTETGSYKFPYRLHKGPSFQCIALEILANHGMPGVLIDTAIEMKNKICGQEVENK